MIGIDDIIGIMERADRGKQQTYKNKFVKTTQGGNRNSLPGANHLAKLQ